MQNNGPGCGTLNKQISVTEEWQLSHMRGAMKLADQVYRQPNLF